MVPDGRRFVKLAEQNNKTMKQIISYDLRTPGRDYSSLYRAIYMIDPNATRILESVWWLTTWRSVSTVQSALSQSIDYNDRLLVVAAGEAKGTNLLG